MDETNILSWSGLLVPVSQNSRSSFFINVVLRIWFQNVVADGWVGDYVDKGTLLMNKFINLSNRRFKVEAQRYYRKDSPSTNPFQEFRG